MGKGKQLRNKFYNGNNAPFRLGGADCKIGGTDCNIEGAGNREWSPLGGALHRLFKGHADGAKQFSARRNSRQPP